MLGAVLVWWQLARGLGRMVQGLGQRAAVVQLAIAVNLRQGILSLALSSVAARRLLLRARWVSLVTANDIRHAHAIAISTISEHFATAWALTIGQRWPVVLLEYVCNFFIDV